MTPLPLAYAWLDQVAAAPRLFSEMRALYGVHEGVGAADNPVILAWAAEVGLQDTYVHDATPWCGLTMAVAAKRAGKPVVAGPLWALNWGKFGIGVMNAALGDVLVFHRLGGGHVGLYVAEDDTAYHVLGGNEGDAVSIVRIAKARCVSVRRPIWKTAQPAGVRRHLVTPGGILSTDES